MYCTWTAKQLHGPFEGPTFVLPKTHARPSVRSPSPSKIHLDLRVRISTSNSIGVGINASQSEKDFRIGIILTW